MRVPTLKSTAKKTGSKSQPAPNSNRKGGVIVGIILLAIIAALLFAGGGSKDISTANVDCSTAEGRAAVVEFILLKQGFKPGEFTVGEDFDFSYPVATQAGRGAFTKVAPKTKAEFVALANSGTPEGNAVKAHAVDNAGVEPTEDNLVGFQLLVESDWESNTLFLNNQQSSAGTRNSGAGDIGWVVVNPKDCRTALFRLGCANPNDLFPTPRRDCVGEGCNPPPGFKKCPPGADDPDGDGFCAIPHDPRVAQPGTETHGNGPTPGYEPGSDGNTQTTVAKPAPSPAGTPGETQTPGGTFTGGDEGVSDPDNSPGYQDEPDW